MTVQSFWTEPFVVLRRRVIVLLRDVIVGTQSCQSCVTIDDITAGIVLPLEIVYQLGACCVFLWVKRFRPFCGLIRHQGQVCFTVVSRSQV